MHNRKILVLTGILSVALLVPSFATPLAIEVVSIEQSADGAVAETALRQEAKQYLGSFKTVAKGAEKNQTAQSAIVNSFGAIAKKGNLLAAATYVDQNITALNPAYADNLMIQYHKMLNKALYTQPAKDGLEKQSVMDALGKLGATYDYDYYKLIQNRNKVKDAKIKALLQSIENRNLRLVNSEGMFFYAPNYINLAKYSSCTTPDMAAYLKFSAMQTIQPYASDGGLIVSEKEMARRIVIGDEILKNYKGKSLEKYVALMQIEQMRSLMYGLDNTPAYDYETKKYKPEVLEAYKLLAAEKNSKAGAYFAEYLELAEKHKYIVDDSTLKDIRVLVSKIEKAYGISDAETKKLIKLLYDVQ